MTYSLLIPAFIAGLLTFLAPCTLPLIPGYLGFISGVSLEDLRNPHRHKKARLIVFFNGVLFTLGFSAVFIALGTLAGLVGNYLAPYRFWLSSLGGILVIIFGLFMMNVLKIPFFYKERKFKFAFLFEKPAVSAVHNFRH